MEQKQRPLGRPRQNKNTKSTKEIILEVATRLFLTQNYQVVSMDEVAKRMRCYESNRLLLLFYKS
ncbi:hypothetical protein AAHB64_24150 [Bacillus toyonensis]